MHWPRDASTSFLEENCLDENVLVLLLGLVPKIQNFQVYKRYDIAPLSPKSKRAQYGESQRDRKNGKNKRDGENGRSEKGERSHCENKINPVVGESRGFEASIYYHIIYRYYQGLMILG